MFRCHKINQNLIIVALKGFSWNAS